MLAFRPEEYAVHTEVYEGPLELLLYLIRRDGIDVKNIPIAHVTREYLAYLDMMTEMDLDVAGDFVLMAATLCQLKSRELLPRSPELDEDEDEDGIPREQLARRLLEYQRYKEASEELAQRQMLGREVFKRPPTPLRPDEQAVIPGVDTFGLLEVFYAAIQRSAAEPPVHEVELEQYSMVERVRWLLETLVELEGATLEQIFSRISTRPQRILSFLSLLEMARLQMIGIEQVGHLHDIRLFAKVSVKEARFDAIPDHRVES